MKSVVFGGAGFLGSHVADALVIAGHEVVVADRVRSPYLTSGQQMRVVDITDGPVVESTLDRADYVYHFAGLADLDYATVNPVETITQNILGTAVVVEAAARANVKRFVFASTIYVYSALGGFYRCSKQAAEIYLEEYHRRLGLDYTVLRYGTVYGPRADNRNSVWRYLHQALTQGRIVFNGSGDEVREYIDVRDAARLSVLVLDEAYRNRNLVISGHHPMKAREMLAMVREVLRNRVDVEFSSQRSDAHYVHTPYSFLPRVGHKLVDSCYVDMGQGLLECLEEISASLDPSLKEYLELSPRGIDLP